MDDLKDYVHFATENPIYVDTTLCCNTPISGKFLTSKLASVTCPLMYSNVGKPPPGTPDTPENRTKKLVDAALSLIERRIKDGTATSQEIIRAIRPNWDDYFLDMAVAVAARADCARRKVGAVLVDYNRRVIGTGYNGAPPGGPSCLAGECPRGKMSTDQVAPGSSYDTGAGTCIALHAEQNALLYSDYTARTGGVIYITTVPCDACMRMLKGAGLRRAVWREEGMNNQSYIFGGQGYIKHQGDE